MTITIHPDVEQRLRSKARAEGLSVEAYVDLLVRADQSAEEELTALAMEGLNSGPPLVADDHYWAGKHRRLDENLKRTQPR